MPPHPCRRRSEPAARASSAAIMAGASGLASRPPIAQDRRQSFWESDMSRFQKRRIGRTGLEVTELGLGCATLGGSRFEVTRQDAEAIVRAAWTAGVRYVDAAPFYGVGQAERAVGDALRGEDRDAWVLSTKVGRLLRPRAQGGTDDGRRRPLPFDPVYDYSRDAILRSFEDSLQRLGLARIDILYVHDIGRYQHGEAHAGHMRTLRES